MTTMNRIKSEPKLQVKLCDCIAAHLAAVSMIAKRPVLLKPAATASLRH